MKCFMFGVLGGLLFGLSLGTWRLNVSGAYTWTDEQKLHVVCGGFAGVVVGIFVLTTTVLSPIVWVFS